MNINVMYEGKILYLIKDTSMGVTSSISLYWYYRCLESRVMRSLGDDLEEMYVNTAVTQ